MTEYNMIKHGITLTDLPTFSKRQQKEITKVRRYGFSDRGWLSPNDIFFVQANHKIQHDVHILII